MRVLALSTSYPKNPGDSTAPFLRAISRGLADHGWEVDVLLPHHPQLTWPEGDAPVRIHTFRYLPRAWRSLHLWGYAGALRADVRVRPQVPFVAVPALSLSAARLRALTRRLRPDVIHAHWVLPNGPPAAWVAGREGVPLVVSLHGSGVFLAERAAPLGWAARYAFRRAAAVTACSGDLSERAQRLGARPTSCTVIPYGVDPQEFRTAAPAERASAREALGVPAEGVLVAAVGRLVEKKGLRHLLDAVARTDGDSSGALAPLELAVAGSGDLLVPLQDQARRLGLADRVRWLGNQDRAGVRRLLRAADVLAVPSVRDDAGNVDGLPNVLLEGMASGLPLVASRVAGIPDVIRDDENGLLVPERDPDALGAALRRLAVSPELRARLGQEARRAVEETLNWRSVTARYAQVLRAAAGADP